MNCGLLNTEFKGEFENLINSLIKNEDDPSISYSKDTILKIFKKGLLDLKSIYGREPDFISSMQEYLGGDEFQYYIEDYPYLSVLNEFNIESVFEGKNIQEQERGSKTDSLALVQEKAQKNSIAQQFLNKYFPLASTSKLFFLRNIKNRIVRAAFHGSHGLVTNEQELTESFEDLKRTLEEELRETVKINGGNPNTFSDLFYRDATKAFEYITDILKIRPSIDEIQKIPLLKKENYSQLTKTTLKGWQAMIALKHFDELVQYIFDKAIIIKYPGEELGLEDKYKINYGDKVSTTWRDENVDVDETEEIASLPLFYLESLSVYDENDNVTDDFLSFSDVKVTLGTLMRELDNISQNKILSQQAIDILTEDIRPLYGNVQTSDVIDTFVKGKTFKQILAATKEHPALLFPVIFRCLRPLITTDITGNLNIDLSFNLNFNRKVKSVINTIYHNIFENNESSLYNLSVPVEGINPDIKNLYDQIVTLFVNIENKQTIEYSEDEDGIKVKLLSDKNADDRVKLLSRALEGKYKKENPQGDVIDEHTTQFKGFKVIDNLESDLVEYGLQGISIELDDPNLKIFVDSELNVKYSGPVSSYSNFIIETLSITPEIWEAYNSDAENALKMCAKLLYNYFVSKHLFGVTNDTYKDKVKKYYHNDPPTQMYRSLQPSLISKGDFTGVLTNISKARDLVEGYSNVSTVRDGQRKQISILGLSSLLSKTGEIWENHTKSPDSPCNGFSLFNLFTGAELIRDFASIENTKQAKEFTANELAKASILYDMYEGMQEQGESHNHGYLRIMGPVVSDKSNLIKLRFKYDAIVPNYTKNGRAVRLIDLTIDDLKTLIHKEFGDYYQKVYNNIENQFNIVNKYVAKVAGDMNLPAANFDFKTNFSKANAAYGSDALTVLHRAIYEAQQNGEDIEIISNVHYVSKKGQLENNPSIIHQLKLFGKADSSYITNLNTDETFDQFMHRKEVQLITDFLQAGVDLRVMTGQIDKKGLSFAKEKNADWLKYGKIAICKVNNTKITSFQDLKDWYPYQRFREENSDFEYSLDNPLFDLEKTLTEINKRTKLWALLEEENFKKLLEESDYDGGTIEDTEMYYKENRLKYSPELSEEQLEEAWQKKKEKDFNSEEKIKEYNKRQYLRRELEKSYTSDKYQVDYDTYKLEVNPELIKHNLYDLFLGEEFVMATTGTYVAHPTKVNNSIQERESSQFGQAVKRYVSYTASKHREATNLLNGITQKLNFAIFEDDFDSSWNYSGDFDARGTKPFDGATFQSITMNYLDNNSLGGDAMGVTKKPFCHYLGTKSGIGFILKTAGFPLTNDLIRTGSPMNARLNKTMLNIKWSQDMDWTKDFNGHTINYGSWYVYKNNRWFKYSNPVIKKGQTYVMEQEVDVFGQEQSKAKKIPIQDLKGLDFINPIINTNYDLWRLFGGEYSGHFVDGKLTYEGDNSSVLRLVQAMNNVGVKKAGYTNVVDQFGVDQVLKKAQIHMIATEGAVKYGAANVNTKDAYFNDDYPVTYMQIEAYDYGEQLDAEHAAEGQHVSLMTQVINALGARGYSRIAAQECYEVLKVLGETFNAGALQALESQNPDEFANAMYAIIYKSLSNLKDGDGNIYSAIASSISTEGRLDCKKIAENFPVSHPAILGKVVSAISSEIEKGIRLKFEGGMEVLNPSNKRTTIINNHLAGYYKDHREELDNLEKANKVLKINNPADIVVGKIYRKYYPTDIDPATGEPYFTEPLEINNPTDFYALKARIEAGEEFYETVKDNNGNPLGHDLLPYNGKFQDSTGRWYNFWELASVQTLWNEDIDPDTRKLALRELQEDFNALGEGIESAVRVKVDGKTQTVKVNKQTVTVQAFQAIMPMMYKTQFGLQTGDNVSAIKTDNTFFIRRMLDNWKESKTSQNYFDVELKTLDGNHIYLGQEVPTNKLLELTKVPIQTQIDGDVVYRVVNGKKTYSLPYHTDENNNIVLDVEIYRSPEGQEIIYSKNLTHFFDELTYGYILFNKPNLDLFKQLSESTNKVAIRKTNNLVSRLNRKWKKDIEAADALIKSNNLQFVADKLDEELKEDITLEEILTDAGFSEDMAEFLGGDSKFETNLANKLQKNLTEKSIKDLLKSYPEFRGIILSGLETHTSFLVSLEAIVSRTPAQSQQSFMSMEIVDFATGDNNSAFVNRLQLALQGSDYTLK